MQSEVQYLRHVKTGSIFHPNEKIAARIRRDSTSFIPPKFLRKIGTDQLFTWNKHLAMRDDMEPYIDLSEAMSIASQRVKSALASVHASVIPSEDRPSPKKRGRKKKADKLTMGEKALKKVLND